MWWAFSKCGSYPRWSLWNEEVRRKEADMRPEMEKEESFDQETTQNHKSDNFPQAEFVNR